MTGFLHFLFLFFSLLFLSSCAEKNKSATSQSIAITKKIKKSSKIKKPKFKEKFPLHDSILFEITSKKKIDSIQILAANTIATFYQNNFSWKATPTKTGLTKYKVKVFMDTLVDLHQSRITFLSDTPPIRATYEVVNRFPHDQTAFTQGLFCFHGNFIESIGQKKYSALKKVAIPTGKTLQQKPIEDRFFGEGCTLYDNKIYQLTWKSGVCMVYDTSFNEIKRMTYNTEGWGLTTLGDSLAMSDGTEKIVFRDPSSFSELGYISVYNHKKAVSNLNELETIEGLIYANEYLTNYVHILDPQTGKVLQTIDFSNLLSENESQNADVLNGIAYDANTKRLFVTGKWWPWVFEVKIKY